MAVISEDETLDDLLIGDLKVIQKKKGFRFTLDSALLAHFVTVKERDRAIDLGTGTAVIPLLLSTRLTAGQIWGVEIQKELVEMARRSVTLNGLENRITILSGDLRDIQRQMGGGCFNLVTANPPYGAKGKGLISRDDSRAMSRHELTCVLEDVVASASRLLNYQGRFGFIHRADRLADIFVVLRQYRLEPRRVRFIHPVRDKGARLVLIEARKSAPPDLQVLAPLIVYEKPGRYSKEILQWYGQEEAEPHE